MDRTKRYNKDFMKTYVVIPHYIITDTVAELARNTIKSFRDTSDVVIVSCDDCSETDTGFLKDISDVYIRNKENKGFAGNCNVGFKWILKNEKEECNVICANNDIEVFDGWLDEFNRILDISEARAIGGLGYKDRIVEGMPIQDYRNNPGSKYSANYYSQGGYLEDWMFPGGFYMIRKSMLDDYGLYDEGFLHGGYEDIDLFLRWKNAGEKLIITPKVQYWHKEGATRFSEEEKGKQISVEDHNREYFCKKNGFNPHENILDFMKDDRINL